MGDVDVQTIVQLAQQAERMRQRPILTMDPPNVRQAAENVFKGLGFIPAPQLGLPPANPGAAPQGGSLEWLADAIRQRLTGNNLPPRPRIAPADVSALSETGNLFQGVRDALSGGPLIPAPTDTPAAPRSSVGDVSALSELGNIASGIRSATSGPPLIPSLPPSLRGTEDPNLSDVKLPGILEGISTGLGRGFNVLQNFEYNDPSLKDPLQALAEERAAERAAFEEQQRVNAQQAAERELAFQQELQRRTTAGGATVPGEGGIGTAVPSNPLFGELIAALRASPSAGVTQPDFASFEEAVKSAQQPETLPREEANTIDIGPLSIDVDLLTSALQGLAAGAQGENISQQLAGAGAGGLGNVLGLQQIRKGEERNIQREEREIKRANAQLGIDLAKARLDFDRATNRDERAENQEKLSRLLTAYQIMEPQVRVSGDNVINITTDANGKKQVSVSRVLKDERGKNRDVLDINSSEIDLREFDNNPEAKALTRAMVRMAQGDGRFGTELYNQYFGQALAELNEEWEANGASFQGYMSSKPQKAQEEIRRRMLRNAQASLPLFRQGVMEYLGVPAYTDMVLEELQR